MFLEDPLAERYGFELMSLTGLKGQLAIDVLADACADAEIRREIPSLRALPLISRTSSRHGEIDMFDWRMEPLPLAWSLGDWLGAPLGFRHACSQVYKPIQYLRRTDHGSRDDRAAAG